MKPAAGHLQACLRFFARVAEVEIDRADVFFARQSPIKPMPFVLDVMRGAPLAMVFREDQVLDISRDRAEGSLAVSVFEELSSRRTTQIIFT